MLILFHVCVIWILLPHAHLTPKSDGRFSKSCINRSRNKMNENVKSMIDLILFLPIGVSIDWWYSIDRASSFKKSTYFNSIRCLVNPLQMQFSHIYFIERHQYTVTWLCVVQSTGYCTENAISHILSQNNVSDFHRIHVWPTSW